MLEECKFHCSFKRLLFKIAIPVFVNTVEKKYRARIFESLYKKCYRGIKKAVPMHLNLLINLEIKDIYLSIC